MAGTTILQLTLAAVAGALAEADPLGQGATDAELVGEAEPDAAVVGAAEPEAAVVGAVAVPAAVGAAEPDGADAAGEAQLASAELLTCDVTP